jgi:hypothetical protein
LSWLKSQFFANVYLNELDLFVKEILGVKYYIRYVDDFVILDSDKDNLRRYKILINQFLKQKLKIELHPDKSNILRISSRLNFLGFRIFFYHRLLKKSNMAKMRNKFEALKRGYKCKKVSYDIIYDFLRVGLPIQAMQIHTGCD